MEDIFSIIQFLRQAVKTGASDEHLMVGHAPYLRINGFIKKVTSVIVTNLFIGFVVPKLNQGLTNKLRSERKHEQKPSANPSFKGGIAAINKFTNAIENTNTGKLLSKPAAKLTALRVRFFFCTFLSKSLLTFPFLASLQMVST